MLSKTSLSIKERRGRLAWLCVLLATFLLCVLAFAMPNFASATASEGQDQTQDAGLVADDATRVEMHRLYNSWTGEHFYTKDTTEKDSLVSGGWKYEGVEWIAPSVSDIKVYRLYNPYVSGGDHHYTTDSDEYNRLPNDGWKQEGVAWYGVDKDEDGAVPLLRQYNPYSETGTHNYTKSEDEQNNLLKLGWRAEGVGWYGYTDMKTAIDFTKVNISPSSMTYTGKQLKPTVTIAGLKQGTDYAVTYGTNINAGTGAGSITITGIGSKTGTKTIYFNINKADPKYTAPGTLSGVQEQTLSQIALPSATNGKFTWKSPTTKLTKTGKQTFAAVFTPNDTKNYNTKNINVTVDVKALYTVTFNAGEGTTVNSQKVVDGSFAKEPTTPVKDGKTFAGWYTDPSYSGEPFNFSKTAITSNITLYGKWNIVVEFNNNSHGNVIADKVVDATGHVTEPTAEEIGVAEGLELEGWYEDEFCTGDKFDLNGTITENVTLYANWTPSKTGDLKKYWISPSMATTTGNTTGAANQDNDNYVSAAWNVKKSSAEIDADVEKIAAGDAVTIAEYKAFMTNDDYHLYTVWNGSKTDLTGDFDENGFVEARIVEVGSHNTDSEGTTALTFQTTHVLPSAEKMNSADESSDGWTKSELNSNLNEFTGSVYGKLNPAFTDKITSPNKSSVAIKNGDYAKTTSRDKLWIASTVEIFGTDPYLAAYGISEGQQYAFWKNLGITGTASTANPALQICVTRAGNAPLGFETGDGAGAIWQRTASNLSTTVADNKNFSAIDNSGKSTSDLASMSEGVVLSFCFAGSDVQLNFDENGHGNAVQSQTVKHGGYATDPASQAGDVEGLYVEGWYTDPNCAKETKWDFDEKVSAAGPVTLYANWAPAEDGDLQKYWLGNSKWMTPANTDDTVNIANPDYVDGGANRNVYKSSAEIDADIDAIALEAFNGTADEPDSVTNEWKGYMTSDKYHLYVAWNGTDTDAVGASDENKFMECRILEVGNHNSAVEGDTTVTFQATHCLPIGFQLYQYADDQKKGWKNSWLRADMNTNTDGQDRVTVPAVSIFTKFATGFSDRVQGVTKYSQADSSATTGVVDGLLASVDKFWLLSFREYLGRNYTEVSDNSQKYAYYEAVGDNAKKTFNANLIRTRAGNDVDNSRYKISTLPTPIFEGGWTRTSWELLGYWKYIIVQNGKCNESAAGLQKMNGVAPAFSFASKNCTVKFDNQGHGNAVADKTVLRDSTDLDDPTASAGTSEGLVLEGWYTDARCTTGSKWNFDTSNVTKDMTLYANWVPATNGDAQAFWMAPSSKITTGNSDTNANITNEGYVAANVNVFKSSAEIKADVAKIKAGDTETIAEYKDLMAKDEYHLYTAWNGSNTDATGASDENKFAEFRIVEVGAHNAESEGTSALTFMGTHLLPQAYQIDPTDASTLTTLDRYYFDSKQIYKDLNSNTGAIFASFNKKFTNSITPVQKMTWLMDRTNVVSSASRLWLMSYSELVSAPTGEGVQYGFYADKQIDSSNANECLKLTTRAGRYPKDSANSNASYYLRTPTSTSNFYKVSETGTFTSMAMTSKLGIALAFCL